MRIIGGKYRGKKLNAPDGMDTRPTADRARESLFNIIDAWLRKNGMMWSELSVLDVFAGTGAVGVEALSRGAKQAVFIENNKSAVRVIQSNLVDGGKVLDKDVLCIGKASVCCNLVFLDPPYQKGLVEPALTRLLQQNWIDEKALVIVEVEKNETIRPVGFEQTDERIYGKAKFIFLRRIL